MYVCIHTEREKWAKEIEETIFFWFKINTAMFYEKKKKKNTRITEKLVRNMHMYVLKCDIYNDLYPEWIHLF